VGRRSYNNVVSTVEVIHLRLTREDDHIWRLLSFREEEVIAYFKVLPQHLERLKKSTKNVCQDINFISLIKKIIGILFQTIFDLRTLNAIQGKQFHTSRSVINFAEVILNFSTNMFIYTCKKLL